MIARRYCTLVDRRRAHEPDEFLDLVAARLLDLARAANELPMVEGDDLPRPQGRTTDQWKALYDSLGTYLGPRNRCWHVHDPRDPKDDEPCSTSLADDLADIYLALRVGLTLWEQRRQSQAVWEWRFGYWNLWGQHLVAALPAIYAWQSRKRF